MTHITENILAFSNRKNQQDSSYNMLPLVAWYILKYGAQIYLGYMAWSSNYMTPLVELHLN